MSAALRTRWRRRAAGAGVFALLTCLGGTALAETCAVVPGASEFTIEDLGRVVFEELSTDRAADSVRFGGSVCLEVAGARVTIRAEALEVERLSGQPLVTGARAEVRTGPWLLGATQLWASAGGVRLEAATLQGDGVVGLADMLELRVSDGALTGTGLVVATPSLRVDMAAGSFDGRVLSGSEVAFSTCDCPPQEAGLRLEGRTARYALDTGVLEVEHGSLVIAGVRVPLPARVTLSEETLASVRLPFALVRDDRRGWLLELVERVEDGVRVGGDVALSDLQPPRVRTSIVAADDQASLALSLTSGGLAMHTTMTRPLADDLTMTLSQRIGGGLADPLQDAVIALRYGPDQALAALPPGATAASLETALALTAQRRGGVEVASARALAALRVDVASERSTLGTLRVRSEAGASGYAAFPDAQYWWGLTPRWELRFPQLSVTLRHVYRGVVGRSPFDDEVDLVEPRQRTTAQLGTRAADGAWRLDLEVRFDWLADARRPGQRLGVERLRLVGRADAIAAADGGPALRWSGTLELAGLVDPRVDRDAYARVGVRALWPDAAPELALEATLGLVPGALAMRELTLAASLPLRWREPDLELRPYLAFDVWPALRGEGWPVLRAHGLALVWASAYGTLDVAYRSESDGSATSSLAFRVDVREPRLEDLQR